MTDSTYRERREARAERLRGWAEKRETSAAAVLKAGEPFRSDNAFNTQPGHIPFRAKLIAREDRAHESLSKARSMRSRADGIDAQAAGAIYSDDPDAIEALRAKLERLEAERATVKAFNASCRKGAPAWELLTEAAKRSLLRTAEVCPYQVTGKNGKFKGYPGYHLSNLGGVISTTRARLAELEARA